MKNKNIYIKALKAAFPHVYFVFLRNIVEI